MNIDPSRDAAVVPVFPLPNVVLFPQTILPLHVFEARYRAMIQDVMTDEGLIVMALLRPGYETDYDGTPPIHSVGTLGRIEDLQLLEDGRFLFNLVGLQRVDLEEVASDRPYRLVRTTPRPDLDVDERDPELDRSKLELLASHGMLMRELGSEDASTQLVNDALGFDCAVNGSCANLPAAPSVRQELLELDDPRLRQQRALYVINDVLREVIAMRVTDGDTPAIGLN